MLEEETARRILDATHSIALIGASANPQRDSNRVMAYLLQRNFRVVPVNPNAAGVLGQRCFCRLTLVPIPIDTVVCFRRSEEIYAVAEDAVAVGAHHLWMQFGVTNDSARALAESEGMLVVMDRCIMVDHRRFGVVP